MHYQLAGRGDQGGALHRGASTTHRRSAAGLTDFGKWSRELTQKTGG